VLNVNKAVWFCKSSWKFCIPGKHSSEGLLKSLWDWL